MNYSRLILWLFLSLCAFILNGSAQKIDRAIDKKYWEEKKNSLPAYGKIPGADGRSTTDRRGTIRDWKQKRERDSPQRQLFEIPQIILQLIKWTLIVGVVIALIFLALQLSRKIPDANVAVKQGPATSPLEDDLQAVTLSEIESALQQALEDQDYSLAVRYQYILLLKWLAVHEIIQWKKDKTNADYLREMQQEGLRKEVRHFTSQYNMAWFGDKQISLQDYDELKGIYYSVTQEHGR